MPPTPAEERVNRAAEFLPQTSDDELPAVRVADALIFAYWKDGILRVSIDTSDIAECPGCVAVRVDVENDTVYTRNATHASAEENRS